MSVHQKVLTGFAIVFGCGIGYGLTSAVIPSQDLTSVQRDAASQPIGLDQIQTNCEDGVACPGIPKGKYKECDPSIQGAFGEKKSQCPGNERCFKLKGDKSIGICMGPMSPGNFCEIHLDCQAGKQCVEGGYCK